MCQFHLYILIFQVIVLCFGLLHFVKLCIFMVFCPTASRLNGMLKNHHIIRLKLNFFFVVYFTVMSLFVSNIVK